MKFFAVAVFGKTFFNRFLFIKISFFCFKISLHSWKVFFLWLVFKKTSQNVIKFFAHILEMLKNVWVFLFHFNDFVFDLSHLTSRLMIISISNTVNLAGNEIASNHHGAITQSQLCKTFLLWPLLNNICFVQLLVWILNKLLLANWFRC